VFNWGVPTPASVDFDDASSSSLPACGTAHTLVQDKQQVLFYSIEWIMTASVNGKVIAQSTPKSQPHTKAELARWTRAMYRHHQRALRMLGVDVDREYRRAGGFMSDLFD